MLQEVFLTSNHGSVTLSRLRGRCCVLYIDDYLRARPIEFAEADIFVCEFRYLGRRLHFKRFNAWPYAEEVRALDMEDRPNGFAPQRRVLAEEEGEVSETIGYIVSYLH